MAVHSGSVLRRARAYWPRASVPRDRFNCRASASAARARSSGGKSSVALAAASSTESGRLSPGDARSRSTCRSRSTWLLALATRSDKGAWNSRSCEGSMPASSPSRRAAPLVRTSKGQIRTGSCRSLGGTSEGPPSARYTDWSCRKSSSAKASARRSRCAVHASSEKRHARGHSS